MSDSKTLSQEARQSDLAPEMHNDEQDDHRSQAQEVAQQAENLTEETASPTESTKGPNKSGLMGDSTQDTIDHMRDMESSGRIDMAAYNGEPNYDDEDGKYGDGHKSKDDPIENPVEPIEPLSDYPVD